MSDGIIPKRSAPEVARPETQEAPAEKHERPSVVSTERPVTGKQKTESTPPISPVAAPVRSAQKSPLQQEIENVLEEGLLPMYQGLTPKQRKQFRGEGERIALVIEKILNKTKVKIIELIRLIRRWLQLLPGVNVFFLEQEAKIKAEKLMALTGLSDKHDDHEHR